MEDKFLVQTRSQNKASGIKLPAIHSAKKTLVPHEIPEKQLVGISRSRQCQDNCHMSKQTIDSQ